MKLNIGDFIHRLKKRWIITVPIIVLIILSLSAGIFLLLQNDDVQPEEDVEIVQEVDNKDKMNKEASDTENDTKDENEGSDSTPNPQPQPKPEPQPESTGLLPLLVLVNKRTPISPLSYSPNNLTSPDVTKRSGAVIDARASGNLEKMFSDAKDEGLSLMLSNAFRSYATQQTLYNNYVARDGQAAADTYSARPGHSEHQTGLAADIIVPNGTCSLEACFGDLPEGKWLANNAHKYGFIVRYTKTNKSEAGYTYEPWHLRYIGVSDAMSYYQNSASSLETYLGKPAAPDYL